MVEIRSTCRTSTGIAKVLNKYFEDDYYDRDEVDYLISIGWIQVFHNCLLVRIA